MKDKFKLLQFPNNKINKDFPYENNSAINCKSYKDRICLKDKTKCYLKKINNNGLYFDCNKNQ